MSNGLLHGLMPPSPYLTPMCDELDTALEARDALITTGIEVHPVGEELERWRVGDFVFSDADLCRLAKSRGLVEAAAAR